MADFDLIPGEGLRLSLDKHEARLLQELLEEMRRLLEADIPPQDPVRARLFPAAFDDPIEAQSYRDLTQNDLMATKLDVLRTVRERLGSGPGVITSIPDEEISDWLSLLTDLRLAIGTRLDVTEEAMEAELDLKGPDAAALNVLHWLGYIQGTMLETIDKEGG